MRMSLGLQVGSVANPSLGLQLGPELVSNGTFDSNTTGWISNVNAAESVVGGRLRLESATDTAAGKYVYQAVTVESGSSYRLQMELVEENETNGIMRVGDTIAGFQYFNTGVLGLHSENITPTQTTIYISALVGNSSLTGEGALFDNFSIRKIL